MRRRNRGSVVVELADARARRALSEISPDALEAALDEADRGRQLVRAAQRRAKRPAPRLGLGQRGVVRAHGWNWRLQYWGAKDERGHRPQLSVPIGDRRVMSYELAREAADLMMAEISPRTVAPGATCRWLDWCDRYETIYLPNLRPGSRRTIASIITRHVRRAFAELHVHQIRRAHVQTWVANMRARGAAAATIASRYRTLRRMLRCARSEGYAAEVPSAGDIDLPRSDAPEASALDEPSAKAFSPQEVIAIIAAAAEPLRTICMCCAFLGLRIGETLGLMWRDLDLIAGRLSIVQQARAGIAAATKTTSSVAERSIPPRLLEHLRAFRASARPDETFVFTSPRTGRALDDSALRRHHMNPLLMRLGIARRRRGFHGLRHFFGTSGARLGVPVPTLQRVMRHASLASTGIYLDTSTEECDQAIAAIEAACFAAGPEDGVQPRNEVPVDVENAS